MAAGPGGNPLTTLSEWLQARKWLLYERGLNYLHDEIAAILAGTPAASQLGPQQIGTIASSLNARLIGNVAGRFNERKPGAPLEQPPSGFRF